MARRLHIFTLCLLLITVTGISAQRPPIECPSREFLREKLPILPSSEVGYPVLGFFIADAHVGSPGSAEALFTADPNQDGCYERYKAADRFVFTHHGGATPPNMLVVWWADQTMHILVRNHQ